ncbi:MAG: type II secretion system protein [Opitutaceae bacterium]
MNQPAHNSPRKPKAAFTLVEIMIAVVIIGLLASIAMPAFKKIRDSSQDKAVLNNARQLAGAADQYMMETGKSSVLVTALIGATSYIKSLDTIAGETYPTAITQGQAITVSGVAGQRTITYTP